MITDVDDTDGPLWRGETGYHVKLPPTTVKIYVCSTKTGKNITLSPSIYQVLNIIALT